METPERSEQDQRAIRELILLEVMRMPTPTPTPTNVTLLDAQKAVWGPLREAYEVELQQGPSWELARVIQARRRDVVRVLSIPDGTPIVERTAEGLRVVV